VRLAMGTIFVVSFGHPVVGFLRDLSLGSLKGIQSLDPLRIVEEETIDDRNDEDKEIDQPQDVPQQPELLKRVEEGLVHYPPELCEEGINGTYFLRDSNGQRIAVFKPKDEEGSSPNNPKGSPDDKDHSNRGIAVGDGALREVAAYLLDAEHFSEVPQTFMATLHHPTFQNQHGVAIAKEGSLQQFVDNDGSCEDYGPIFPVEQVHKIGILDMRLFNSDRHGGNILVRGSAAEEMELIPIDHGLTLPPTLDHAWFEWLHWPQAKVPFGKESLRYIEGIDVEKDVATLRSLGLQEDAIRTMVISTTLLKKGAAAGLTLFQLGTIVSRDDLEEPSMLETMVKDCGDDIEALFSRMDMEIANLRRK